MNIPTGMPLQLFSQGKQNTLVRNGNILGDLSKIKDLLKKIDYMILVNCLFPLIPNILQ